MTYSPYGQLSEEEQVEAFRQKNAEELQYEDAFRAADQQQAELQQQQDAQVSDGEQPTGEQPTQQEEQPQQEQPQQELKQPGDPGTNPNRPPEGQEDQYTWNEQTGEYELNSGAAVQMVAETVAAPVLGTIDGLADLYNWVAPGPDIPEIPKFRNQNLQTIREVSSFIGPTFMGIGVIGNAAKYVHGLSKFGLLTKLGNNKAFQWFANRGLEAGVGVAVDQSSRHSDEHNFLGHVAKWTNTPEGSKIFGIWGPDVYTMDSDSPDLKRSKNRNEGLMLGWASALLEGAGRIGIGAMKTRAATKWVPKTSESKRYFDSIMSDEFADVKFSDNVIEDTILRSEARQEKALDELGDYFMVKQNEANLDEALPLQTVDQMEFDQPVKGVHDMFDFPEGGVRTVDEGGVPAAMVDAARIKNNIGTNYGRVGSIVTESALRYGMDGANATKRQVVGKIKGEILNSGRFDAVVNGKVLTDKQIDEAGTELAELLMGMDPGEMQLILAPFKKQSDELGATIVNKVGYDAVFKAIKGYQEVFLDAAEKKASGLLTTSLAGQAADMAEELPLMKGTAASEQLVPTIMNRMEYLMVEKALASYDAGRVLQSMNVWERMKRMKNPQSLVKDAQIARERYLGQIVDEAKGFSRQLLAIADEKPEFLKPLYELWAHTDGRLSSMYSLNKYVYESLGAINQAFIRGDNTIPNLIVEGMWSNYYNSILSATSTPVKAIVANIGGLVARPINSMAGMVLSGQFTPKNAHRMFTQYAGLTQAFGDAFAHAGWAWKKAVNNPGEIMEYGRADLASKAESNLGVLQGFAEASMKEGNDGPMILVNQYRSLQDLANSPWMRYGTNAMTAADAFVRSFIASAESRGRAFDELLELGKPVTGQKVRSLSKKIRENMIDENGFIADASVEYYSREIALNLESPMADAMSNLVRYVPAAKPFFMFPRTQANALAMVRKYGPLEGFSKEFYDFNYGAMSSLSMDQIPLEHVEQVLTKRGIALDENAMTTFKQMRYETNGRVAVGTLSILAAGTMFMQGGLTGDGHFDPRRKGLEKDLQKAKRSYKGVDGRWHSYEFLGPLADWIAATVNVMDNSHTLSHGDTEKLFNKLTFVMANGIFNKSIFSMFEPLNDVLNGNPNALSRFQAKTLNAMIPYAGLRRQFSQLISDGLKEVDDDLFSLLRNSNNWLDLFDDDNLESKYDWIDGTVIGRNDEQNFFHKSFDIMRGVRTSPELSKRKQFLLEIEYDSTPSFARDDDGNDLPAELRAKLYYQMGQDGEFGRRLDKIMARAESVKFIQRLRHFRKHGVGSDPSKGNQADVYFNIYNQIDDALRDAKARATNQLRASDPAAWSEINKLTRQKNENETRSRNGTLTLQNMHR